MKVKYTLKLVTTCYFTKFCTYKVWKTEATGYYWLLLVTTLGSAHFRSGKRKPIFKETYYWLLHCYLHT